MSPCTFQRTTVLNAPIESVFAFHNDPRNVGKISPGWQSVRILRAEPTARAGEEFEMEVRLFGLFTMRWTGVWLETEPPHLLVDGLVSGGGPFAVWRHRHEFRVLDDSRTEMTDHVTYRFAGGWPGWCFSQTLGRWQMHLMFADRHARTRRRMLEHMNATESAL
jgi:ligand-binding SRPBCC domain-containing protein